MKHTAALPCLLGLLLLLLTGFARADADSLPVAPKPLQSVRTDSLELPGVTACHICEWRPHLDNMPAQAQCGAATDGRANYGVFECGESQDCKRECRFVRCGMVQ